MTLLVNFAFQYMKKKKTQWTTDQDITDAVSSIGIADFQEVKFFENRANGQSKGFCVVTLGSEQSMRMCLDRLPKNDLHGQKPMVTLPTKAALAQFESQQKTRPIPPAPNATRGQAPMQPGGPMQGNQFPGQGPQGPPRMMMPNGPNGPGGPGGFRPQHMPPQNMGMPPNQGPPRMQVAIKHILFDIFGQRLQCSPIHLFIWCTLLMMIKRKANTQTHTLTTCMAQPHTCNHHKMIQKTNKQRTN